MQIALAGLVMTLAACSPSKQSEVTLNAPGEGAQVQSPMEVSGVAPNNWFFEAVFPLKLVDKDGKVLAEAPARPETDWMVEGPVNFNATLEFAVTEKTPATLVLEEDMPRDDAEPRRLERAVVLVPKK